MSSVLDAQTPGQALAIALRLGADHLGHSESPMTDARVLLAHAAGVEAGRLPLLDLDDFNEAMMTRYVEALHRRMNGEPISHILGSRAFWKHRFHVTGDVLDPRPETEILVEQALEGGFSTVLDLGTGSGCILLSLLAERPEVVGTGTDLSPEALVVAEWNARQVGVSSRVNLMQSDWFDSVEGRFDLIVSNPPYIALHEMAGLAPELSHEPRLALTDEGDGLASYRVIVPGALAHLAAGGRLMVEIGPGQGVAVAAMFTAAGFGEVTILPDLDGRDRAVMGRMPPMPG